MADLHCSGNQTPFEASTLTIDPSPRVRVSFVIEWGLGHVTHGLNLQAAVNNCQTIDASWHRLEVDVGRIARRVPGYGANWTIRSGIQAHRRIARDRRAPGIDALFVHTGTPAVGAASHFDHVPTVVSIDATPVQIDALAGYPDAARWEVIERVKRAATSRAFAKARRVVAVSDWAASSLVDDYNVDAAKIVVVPFGVRTDLFSPGGAEGTGPVRLLFVGGDFERKGGSALLRSFDELAARHDVVLDLVTSAPVAERPGVVVHRNLGPLDPALIALYQKADIFCLPTLGDCLPLVILEASASGLPSVVTAVGGIAEAVIHGHTGLVVPPDSQTKLTDALEQLILDPAQRTLMGERAAARMAASFDAATNGQLIVELLKSIAVERVAP